MEALLACTSLFPVIISTIDDCCVTLAGIYCITVLKTDLDDNNYNEVRFQEFLITGDKRG
ncbi:hypothetical protein BDR06DRAFT_949415 [Suillus hirtellus]|nr:hypothetical protein BDR06DRAFT_949415 [Suillus hirtellus]